MPDPSQFSEQIGQPHNPASVPSQENQHDERECTKESNLDKGPDPAQAQGSTPTKTDSATQPAHTPGDAGKNEETENAAKNRLAGETRKELNATKDETSGPDEKSMGLFDHLAELRQRLTKAAIAAAFGFAICWIFVDPLFDVLMKPLLEVLPPGTHAQYTTLPEAFFTRMRIAFVAGVFLASPFIFYQIWAFVAPGLYDEEKRLIVPIAALSALFFVAGGLFCYYIVFPFAFNFFISYSTPEIVITPKISDYLSFCLKLIFAFGLIFEMPIFTFFLARMGILTANLMRQGRKYAIVGIFIIAAILTPPDVVSQILMACPMLLLYEASIGVAAIFGKKKAKQPKKENATDEPA